MSRETRRAHRIGAGRPQRVTAEEVPRNRLAVVELAEGLLQDQVEGSEVGVDSGGELFGDVVDVARLALHVTGAAAVGNRPYGALVDPAQLLGAGTVEAPVAQPEMGRIGFRLDDDFALILQNPYSVGVCRVDIGELD